MSPLYFGLAVFCLFEARVTEFDTQLFSLPYTAHCTQDPVSNSGTLDSNWQNTSSPKYKDDISMLISQYLISVPQHVLPATEPLEQRTAGTLAKLWRCVDLSSSAHYLSNTPGNQMAVTDTVAAVSKPRNLRRN
jgi:hypothetical protein